MLRIATAALLFGISFSLNSGEIEYARASHVKGEYQVEIAAKLTGNWHDIYNVATDFEKLSRLSDIIIDSGVVESNSIDNSGTVRRWLITRICFPLYCFRATLVEDVQFNGSNIIKTNIVPDESDFEYGEAEWQIKPEGDENTVITFHSRFKPAFWVPPLIGPILVKRIMLNVTKQTILAMEKIVRDE
jgi:hypothetical protein